MKSIGIDLGTANTIVYLKGKGIVLREPSVVAVDQRGKNVVAVGNEAKLMLGKTPGSITAMRPLKNGVIAEFDATAAMLRHFFKKVSGNTIMSRPKVIICIPYGVTEVAVLSLGGIVLSTSLRVAGDELDDAISSYIKRKYNILIGDVTAETLKKRIGSVHPSFDKGVMEIRGRNLLNGLPAVINVTSAEIRESMADEIRNIIDSIRTTLENTPPELSSDIYDTGIVLSGGGALLPGLDLLVSRITGIRTVVAKHPLDCVAIGIGRVIESMGELSDVVNFRAR